MLTEILKPWIEDRPWIKDKSKVGRMGGETKDERRAFLNKIEKRRKAKANAKVNRKKSK